MRRVESEIDKITPLLEQTKIVLVSTEDESAASMHFIVLCSISLALDPSSVDTSTRRDRSIERVWKHEDHADTRSKAISIRGHDE
jgi:hypothetical protein